MNPKKHQTLQAIVCLIVVAALFTYFGMTMGVSNMLGTLTKTAYGLIIETCFTIMALCVLTGALSSIFSEFGVIRLFQKLLNPLMKPLFGLPGTSSIGAVVCFFADNPAIAPLARDRRFAAYFKNHQMASIVNFATGFGMGFIVLAFMLSLGYVKEPMIGLAGALIGTIVSTRLMQWTVKHEKKNEKENFNSNDNSNFNENENDNENDNKEGSANLFMRIMDAILDGGKSGVKIGLSIIPGVVVITTLVIMFTFGTADGGAYTGAAYEGTGLLPMLAEKINIVFDWLFGFKDPHLIAFPVTALGAVGAAIGFVPSFIEKGWVDGNAIAVFTGIGVCWAGFLSSHAPIFDAIGYRKYLGKGLWTHFIGGIVAGVAAHFLYLLLG